MQPTPAQYLATHRLFSRAELLQALTQEDRRTVGTVQATLGTWLRSGLVRPVKRGVFVRNGGQLESSDYQAIGCRMAPDAILAYGTALVVHGLSQVLFEDIVYATWTKTLPLGFENRRFVPVRPRAELKRAAERDGWTTRLDRGPYELCVTSLERTVVDVLDRPELAAGPAEVWRALFALPHLELDDLVAYARLLARPTLVAKLGVLLERRKGELDVPERVLAELERFAPRKPVYWKRGLRGRLERRWNVIVPEALFSDDTWGEA